MSDFWSRFENPTPDSPPPVGLQLLFADPLDWDDDAIRLALHSYHPDMASARIELVNATGDARAAKLVGGDGPPVTQLGLIDWGVHTVQLLAFNAPMPYGPLEVCVGPAMIAPPLKVDAKQHQSHVLLFYAGQAPEVRERYVALGAVAGALARFGAVVVLNEEARAAVPASDLIPDPGEDALQTLRQLPIPYLWGGFLKLNVGDPDRPWVRTFANHRFGLPEFARQLAAHSETSQTFRLFTGLIGYLEETQEQFHPGDTLDLGEDGKRTLRAPTETEWFLDAYADGTMLVVE